MNFFKRFSSPYKNPELGLFLVRIALAVTFIARGWHKSQNMPGTIAFFESRFERGRRLFHRHGGARKRALLAGVYIRWAGLLLAMVMANAILLVKVNTGFIGGFELETVLLLCALAMVAAYPTSYNLMEGYRGPRKHS